MTELVRPIGAFGLKRRTDDEVFARALRGDDLAFSEVYHRYYSRIYGFCLSRTGSPEIAHDAAQETFTRLLSTDAQSVKSPVSWLFSVARNVCVDVIRRQSKTLSVEDIGTAADSATDAGGTPAEDEALARGDAAVVFLALRRMRPRYRNALVLREIHHQSMEAIAETLKVREATAYTVLSRARDAFGRAYAQVLELPAPCRLAVERLYRRSGTGLSAAEVTALDLHVGQCARCQRERERAADLERMPALLPFLSLNARGGVWGNAARVLGRTAPSLDSATRLAGPLVGPSIGPVASVASVAAVAVISLTVAVGGGVAAQRAALIDHADPVDQSLPADAQAAATAISGPLGTAHEVCESRATLTRTRQRNRDADSSDGSGSRRGAPDGSGYPRGGTSSPRTASGPAGPSSPAGSDGRMNTGGEAPRASADGGTHRDSVSAPTGSPPAELQLGAGSPGAQIGEGAGGTGEPAGSTSSQGAGALSR